MSNYSKTFVILQFFCLIYFIFFTNFFADGFGFIIQIIGFLLALWAVITLRIGNFNVQPEVKKGTALIQNGPYKFIRNPMYTGLLLFFGSGVFSSFKWSNLLVFLLLLIILILKIRYEEKFLLNEFGESYEVYKKKSFRLIPYLY